MLPNPTPFEKFNNVQYYICEIQGRLFKLAQTMDFDDDDFIQKFMHSDFCKRALDQLYSPYQMADPEDVMDETLRFITPKKNAQHYDSNTIDWIGYMYRYLHLRLAIPSAVIYDTLPLKDMLVSYVGMHTQDDEYFVDVIKDKFKRESL